MCRSIDRLRSESCTLLCRCDVGDALYRAITTAGVMGDPDRQSRWPSDVVQDVSGFYALIAVCTHLDVPAEQKFKCPCHGSGFRLTGINFEGPAPRERAAISLTDDGQILVDKTRRFQFELGQWADSDSFLKA